MNLTVEKEILDTTVILKLKGILDISTTNNIDPYLEDIEFFKLLIFDFSELEFIDSTGIGSIMNAIHLSQEKGFKLKLQGINELTHQVFEMIGIYQILEVVQGEVV
ncbi:STAS domain-containing protein [Alkalihalobacillus sp. BA299]|uniref:STAS domain-containing protein n=1 Tax=Alkalihalobacillus sp. BA299 TaxID=2815938 RepID=UPI001ADC6B73|nr:STAS domain-containing protein [Alkalihalobacillus sp. BA299]